MAELNEQMEMFENTKIKKDEASKKLDKGVSDLRKERKLTFNKMTKMLESGEVKNLSDKDKRNFVELYKLLKQHHFNKKKETPLSNFFDAIKEGGNKKFQEGGLEQDGGTQDPVSGNEVPAGSSQAEVRDDIPAMLSEGEFVFPADVVRFIGLEKLMQIRQEAKAGLKRMEDMGQMGNSSEATIPDDVPFNVDDLEVEEDTTEPKKFVIGGSVPQMPNLTSNYGVYFTPSSAQTTQGVTPFQSTPLPQYQAPPPLMQTPTPLQQQPSMTGTQTFPDFLQPAKGEQSQLKTYINPQTGVQEPIMFINNNPTKPIPEGFIPIEDYVKPETTKTEEVKPETTKVSESEKSQMEEGEQKVDDGFGEGAGRVSIGGELDPERPGFLKKDSSKQYGVSFKTGVKKGLLGIPSIGSTASFSAALATGKPLPKQTIVTITRGNVSMNITADAYNELKENNFRGDKAEIINEEFNKLATNDKRIKQADIRSKKAQDAMQRAKNTGSRIKAEKEYLISELSKFGEDITDSGDLSNDALKKQLDTYIENKRNLNATNRKTSVLAYEDEQGEQKSDYSFSDYSSNVASGTEDRGYGAAYDEDVLGLSD